MMLYHNGVRVTDRGNKNVVIDTNGTSPWEVKTAYAHGYVGDAGLGDGNNYFVLLDSLNLNSGVLGQGCEKPFAGEIRYLKVCQNSEIISWL